MNSLELLKKLVAFPTVSRDSNLRLIEFVQGYLADFGIQARLIHNEDGTKANLWATIGPTDTAGIVLSGHTDVVPVDNQPWSSDPFTATLSNDRLYGRGSCDMKGFLACVLAAVPGFTKAALKRPVHLAFSYDEERGCLGAPDLIKSIGDHEQIPLGCIIGEPTQMQPMLGHKGKRGVRCRVHGAACHSAFAPYGVNAIEYAAKLIDHLGSLQETLKAPEHRDERFDPPFSTLQVGLISGGNALNIVPAECQFDWEVRSLPGLNDGDIEKAMRSFATEVLEKEMQQISSQAHIEFEMLQRYPGLGTSPHSPMAELIAEITGRSDFSTVAFGTEGGLFSNAGIPAVVCGPGNMEQGHKADEYIALSELDRCDQMLAELERWLCKDV